MNRAADAVAVLGPGESRASDTAIQGSGNDRASTSAASTATRLGASLPIRPPADLAVNWAGLGVAETGLVFRALGTTMGSILDIDLCARLGARAAGDRARSPLTPVVHAVDGAGVGVASLLVFEARAFLAAMGSRNDHRSSAGENATTANNAANIEGRPLCYTAVNGARRSVAVALLLEVWARLTSVLHCALHLSAANLLASLTGERASGPFGPFGDKAINGARLGVASPFLGVGTFPSAVSGLSEDGNRANLSTCATGLGANAPLVKSGLAVNRARMSLAHLCVFQGRAVGTTMGSGDGNGARTLRHATTAHF